MMRDLLTALALLCLVAPCGCDDPPPALPDLGPIEIDSPLAVTKCDLLSMEIDKAAILHGQADPASAAVVRVGIAQTCWLRLIDYRLRRLVPIDDPGPPPPAPAEAPDTQPKPRPVRKTPLSESGGGPDVGWNPPAPRMDGGAL